MIMTSEERAKTFDAFEANVAAQMRQWRQITRMPLSTQLLAASLNGRRDAVP